MPFWKHPFREGKGWRNAVETAVMVWESSGNRSSTQVSMRVITPTMEKAAKANMWLKTFLSFQFSYKHQLLFLLICFSFLLLEMFYFHCFDWCVCSNSLLISDPAVKDNREKISNKAVSCASLCVAQKKAARDWVSSWQPCVRLTESDVCGVLQGITSFGCAHHTEADGCHRLLSVETSTKMSQILCTTSSLHTD